MCALSSSSQPPWDCTVLLTWLQSRFIYSSVNVLSFAKGSFKSGGLNHFCTCCQGVLAILEDHPQEVNQQHAESKSANMGFSTCTLHFGSEQIRAVVTNLYVVGSIVSVIVSLLTSSYFPFIKGLFIEVKCYVCVICWHIHFSMLPKKQRMCADEEMKQPHYISNQKRHRPRFLHRDNHLYCGSISWNWGTSKLSLHIKCSRAALKMEMQLLSSIKFIGVC